IEYRTTCCGPIEPNALRTHGSTCTIDRDVGLTVVVVTPDDGRVVAALPEGLGPHGIAVALQYIPERISRRTRTTDREIVFQITIVIFGDEEIGRNTPSGTDRCATAVGKDGPRDLAGGSTAGVSNHGVVTLPIAIEIDCSV